MVNPSPFPTFIPYNTTDAQQLELLHQVQNHLLTPLQAALLGYLLTFQPIQWIIPSLQARLDIYYFLAPLLAHLPIPPVLALAFILSWPVWILVFVAACFYLVKSVLELIRIFAPNVFKKFIPVEETVFLEVTFPSSTSKSAYATTQLYTLLHTLARRGRPFIQRFLGQKKTYSLEIVATKEHGIRYILTTNTKDSHVFKSSLLSYLPGVKVKEVKDYLPDDPAGLHGDRYGISELKLSNAFVLPLKKQNVLDEHDPISYLTGNMTKLSPSEIVSFQIVVTPVLNGVHGKALKEMRELRGRMVQGLPINLVLNKSPLDKLLNFPIINILWFFTKIALKFLQFFVLSVIDIFFSSMEGNKGRQVIITADALERIKPQEILNPYEQELQTIVKGKIDQPLFETSIRLLVATKDEVEYEKRINGLLASFGQMSSSYQSLTGRASLVRYRLATRRFRQFKERALTSYSFDSNPILSTSEISDLYHFPDTSTTKTEGLVKSRSKELPTPLSMKKSATNIDVILGANQYDGEVNPIGLTLEQRQKHMYVIGKTGMGKTTLLTNAIFQDMVNGKGICVLDPHGDMVKELLRIVPKNRIKDVIYFDPSDREFPLGLNILSPGITFANKEDADEWITSSVLTIFAKLTSKEYWGPRMEHILQNACLTALQTPNPSLYTLQRLLTEKSYQQQVASTLKDPVLKQFWQKEFKLLGTMQLSSVTAPLTQRLGHFITTKMSRHILLQGKSTISTQEIMDQGKILLVNLSKGDLGEDQSFFFGTLITSLIWMAAYQRTKIPESKRRDFFVYVDEFQNFATHNFAEIMSEGRKFHISLIPSHQSIAQIDDMKLVKIIAGNAGTIVSLKASPDDEQFILPFMQPEVEKGEIVNLAPFHFYMKVSTDESEDAFSGETIRLDSKGSDKIAEDIIANTRKMYGTSKEIVEKELKKLFEGEVKEESKSKTKSKNTKSTKRSYKKHGI